MSWNTFSLCSNDYFFSFMELIYNLSHNFTPKLIMFEFYVHLPRLEIKRFKRKFFFFFSIICSTLLSFHVDFYLIYLVRLLLFFPLFTGRIKKRNCDHHLYAHYIEIHMDILLRFNGNDMKEIWKMPTANQMLPFPFSENKFCICIYRQLFLTKRVRFFLIFIFGFSHTCECMCICKLPPLLFATLSST